MRILHIGLTPNYGGLESFVMNIYQHIDRQKIQFDFLSYYGEGIAYEEKIKELGGNIFPIIYPRRDKRHFLKPIVGFLSEKKYNIVHLHRTHLGDLDYLWMAKMAGVSHRILHSHSSGHISPMNKVTKVSEHINKVLLDSVVTERLACSQNAGKWMFGNRDFTIVKNAIDIDKFSFDIEKRKTVRDILNIKSYEKVIGHIGNFMPVKNYSLILELAYEFSRSHPEFKFILVGDGPLKDEIHRKVEKFNLSNHIILTGSSRNVAGLMNAFDQFILPSHFEGLPIAAIEAQANGLPVILSDKITNEVRISSNVSMASIENIQQWIVQILANSGVGREDNRRDLIDSGYDICHAANNLQNFYLSLN